MEPEASLGVPSGKCKKHGRGCVLNTLGHVGESPGGDFFQSGSPDPFWKDPGETPGYPWVIGLGDSGGFRVTRDTLR